ncbi:DNA replication protein DnaD [Siminovitchia terrae]|uniref:DNA replication protein DnaD n=1 Tax=Siminovitchia terrae TaxID=1914933 RepID=UPI001B2B22D5|nr:DNA replication protein DnaD [Siminovitchia terrae]GIN93362.1 hypothetical protein J22TS1_44130 [Siminovitchia terrae]
MKGWIKLYRELLDKPIWHESTPEQKTILITLLMMVNHKGKEWEWKGEIYKCEPGQIVTSLPKIVEKCGKGVTIQNVRTALKRFESFGFLTDESTNRNRLITIVKWGVYQGEDEEETDEPTGNQQATNRQLTANKNVRSKECNKKNNSRKQVYDETSIHFQLAIFFYQKILANNPEHKEPNLQRWADDIRKMIELDNRTEEQIKYLMTWVQEDSFEMANVLSPSKLRKRFDQLVIKVKAQKKKVVPINKGRYIPKDSDFDMTAGEDWR